MTYIGHELEKCKDYSSLSYRLPFEKACFRYNAVLGSQNIQGYVVDWDAQKAVWDGILSDEVLSVSCSSQLTMVRELTSSHPIVLVNAVNEYRIEGQKTAAFEIHEGLDGGLEALCIPVGNAGNITSYWRGFKEVGAAPKMFGFQAEGAAPPVEGKIIEHPETVASAIRIGNPVRWEDAMAAATDSRGAIRVVSDAEILSAYRLLASKEGMFCEPASAASVAGLLKYGADGAEQIVCVLTGRGLKDPETAIANNDGRVIQCVAETGPIEEAVLGDP